MSPSIPFLFLFVSLRSIKCIEVNTNKNLSLRSVKQNTIFSNQATIMRSLQGLSSETTFPVDFVSNFKDTKLNTIPKTFIFGSIDKWSLFFSYFPHRYFILHGY